MSNYAQTTFFTLKDSLPTTDPNKTIFGAAYDVEFGNISTAIATKLEAGGSPTFTNLTATSVIAGNVVLTGSVIPTNGWYLPAANTIGAATNGVQRVTINASGTVAINAPTAATALTIAGAAAQTLLLLSPLDSASVGLSIQDPGGNGTFVRLNTNNTNATLQAGGTVSSLAIVIGGTTRLTFASDGGIFQSGATGGSQGANTLNAQALFINGNQLFFGVPASGSTTAAVTDVGKCINAAGSITVPNAVFSQGNAFSIYNNTAGAITITAGITTMRLAGTATTGSRALAARGLATIWFESGTECVVGGSGVS